MSTDAQISGFLLTRQWRDAPGGIDLSFWAATDIGPLRIQVEPQRAVCFIDRTQTLALPAGAERKAVSLALPGGAAVDAIYLQRQRQLAELHRSAAGLLCESDIKPAERYLSERFINAGFVVRGVLSARESWHELHQPRWSALDYRPDFVIASIDIETEGLDGALYSIAIECGEHSVVLMIGDVGTADEDGIRILWCRDERVLLEQFFQQVQRLDPDVIIGWNVVSFDLDFLHRRCQQLQIPFSLARGAEPAIILAPGAYNNLAVARVPGRAVLDGIDLLRAGFWQFENFSLQAVASELLGIGKTLTGDHRVDEIDQLFRSDKPALARYNMQDCRLVTQIFKATELLDFALQRSQMTGLPLDKTGGSVQTLDNLYLPLLHRKGYVAPFAKASIDSGSPGGYVLDSEPGLYENVIVLDFKSLYPSIIRSFLIDPLGMQLAGENAVPGFDGATFSRDTHILPGLIEELWRRRDEAKAQRNQPLSQAIKIIMNSFYGVLGSTGCRFNDQRLASSITRRGHEIILASQQQIEAEGFRVIYGDTDSLFVLLGEQLTAAEVQATGTRLQDKLNHHWQQQLRLQYDLQSCLEVEFETHYRRFFMPTVRGSESGSKKRYAGLVQSSAGTRLVFKGLEAARTDWTPLARSMQRELFERIFNDQPFDELLLSIHQRLFAGELDAELVYRKRLRRQLHEYQRNVPPHVQAARKLPAHQGRWVEYVITMNGPEPVSLQTARPDYEHYYQRQLAPAADGILYFVGTSLEAICGAQQQLF